MAHSCWLTTASRALRLQVSTKNPTNNLKLVVQYTMLVYTLMWFKIKCNQSISHAPLHIFETLPKCGQLPQEVRDIVIPVVERNAFGAHHESLLTAVVTSGSKKDKEIAWRRILRCRQKSSPSGQIRSFRVPKLNTDASSYRDLID